MARRQTDEKEYQAGLEAMERRRAMLNGHALRLLKGAHKTIQHPVDIVNSLDGFGDWIVENDYTPTLASLAAYIGVDKALLYSCSRDTKRYSYYEIQNAQGEVIDIKKIDFVEEIELVKRGERISLRQFYSLDQIIDRYELEHDVRFNEAERLKIKSYDASYFKQFHKRIQSKKTHKGLVTLAERLRTKNGVKLSSKERRKRINRKFFTPEKRLEVISYREVYRIAVMGSVFVRTITFDDVLLYYKQVAELEWIEVGKNARNPAMAIFMLMNNSGYNSMYQNKQVMEYRPSISALEEQQYNARMEELLHGAIEAKGS